MKKLIFILVVMSFLFIGCSNEEPKQEEINPVMLTVRVKLKDNINPPQGEVYIWDASTNEFSDKLNYLDGLKFGKAKEVNGKEVRAIATEKLQINDNPNGSSSDYRFAIFNLDKSLYYYKENKGKVIVLIMLDNTDKYTYKIINWEKGKDILIEKIFESEYPRYTFETW